MPTSAAAAAPRPSLLLTLTIGARRYLADRAHVDQIGLIDPARPPTGSSGRPLICRELGPLLGGAAGRPGRRHALTVALRRRSVVLLVDHIDASGQQLLVQPLAPLLARRLARPWFLGAAICDDSPLLLLDLRCIATDMALGAA